MLLELQKANPNALEFEEMIYIKSSEYTQLKNELISIKNTQSKPGWLTEKVLMELESFLFKTGNKTEQNALITIDSIKTSIQLAEKFGALRQENIELKKRLSESAV